MTDETMTRALSFEEEYDGFLMLQVISQFIYNYKELLLKTRFPVPRKST